MYCEFEIGHLDQKQLYFSLKNAFSLSSDFSFNEKLIGVYAIFNKEVCAYVGMSKNLSSRIATHMKGAYKNADKFLIFTSNYSPELDELYLIKNLKPTDNILADYSKKVNQKNISYSVAEYVKDQKNYIIPTFYIQKEESIIKIGNYDTDFFLGNHPYIINAVNESMDICHDFNRNFLGFKLQMEDNHGTH